MFDYFYGAQAEQFSFYRVPKVLFTREQFKDLSAESKTLYGIMLDKLDLSVKNNWTDEQGRVYIIYTIEQIMRDLNCGNKKAGQLLQELEEKGGLIERKRQGLGRPNLIFVKNFISGVDNSGERHFKKCQNDTSGSVLPTSQEVSERHGINTNNNYTDFNETNPILSGEDEEGMRERYEEYFRKSLSIDVLLHDNPCEKETILGIQDLITDTVCSNRKTIRIAGDDKPTGIVKSRFMKLDQSHMEYILHCLHENTTKVRNMKQYLLATLYNAPTTISPYYQAWVNNDFYGQN
jgi:hypothetical protein